MKKLILVFAVVSAVVAYSNNPAAQSAAPKNSGCAACKGCKKAAAKFIGQDAAISAALAHAGLKRSDIRDLSCELERENGVWVYDVEFESGNMEYDYDIDAKSGAVLKSWKERD